VRSGERSTHAASVGRLPPPLFSPSSPLLAPSTSDFPRPRVVSHPPLPTHPLPPPTPRAWCAWRRQLKIHKKRVKSDDILSLLPTLLNSTDAQLSGVGIALVLALREVYKGQVRCQTRMRCPALRGLWQVTCHPPLTTFSRRHNSPSFTPPLSLRPLISPCAQHRHASTVPARAMSRLPVRACPHLLPSLPPCTWPTSCWTALFVTAPTALCGVPLRPLPTVPGEVAAGGHAGGSEGRHPASRPCRCQCED
jgi:hypothetical protein